MFDPRSKALHVVFPRKFVISDLEIGLQEPVIFLKPTSSYLENGGTIEIPHPLDSLHHEVELALVIGQKARDVPESIAMDYIGGILVYNVDIS